ncbi:MAG: hypothetical protein FWC68_06630 [Oscillospiraceae bacterium]|nr:hypothetical protein [Oscillospiraceae bacterium]
MADKNVIKDMFDDKFNKSTNYRKILSKVEGVSKTKNIVLKLSLIPICLVLVISGVLLFNTNNNNNLDPIDHIRALER